MRMNPDDTNTMSWLRIAGASLAGAVGFTVGYAAGVFLILTVSGLEIDHNWFLTATLGLGSVLAGIAIALTMPGGLRARALTTSVAAGAVVLSVLIAIDGALEHALIGGSLVVLAAALLPPITSNSTALEG